jgi:hypothetical protein
VLVLRANAKVPIPGLQEFRLMFYYDRRGQPATIVPGLDFPFFFLTWEGALINISSGVQECDKRDSYFREVSMVRSLIGVFVLLVPTSLVLADMSHQKRNQNPQITALRMQIKALQAEEKAVLKAIKGQYESILQQDKLSKTQREEIKAALGNEEKDLQALATTNDQTQAIEAEFQLLFQVLSGEVQLDRAVVAKIKKQEKAQVALIRALYKAKIKSLQSLIQALEHKK